MPNRRSEALTLDASALTDHEIRDAIINARQDSIVFTNVDREARARLTRINQHVPSSILAQRTIIIED